MAEVLSKNTSKSFFETRIQTAPPRGASVLEGIVCHRMAHLRAYTVFPWSVELYLNCGAGVRENVVNCDPCSLIVHSSISIKLQIFVNLFP